MSKRPGSSTTADGNAGNGTSDALFWVVSLCFFLSGMAGLIYQMVWMRYLATVFGTSELAIVAVLVAYMGGLAMGASAASKLLNNVRRPIFVYAVLEFVIAVSAIAVPLLIKLIDRLYIGFLGGQATVPGDGGTVEAIANLLLGFAVLIVPTACMGATLPILAKGVVHRSEEIGRRIGWLYALNTFGAVAGTVTAAFFLIPALGLWRSSFIGVGLNLLVAGLGWSVAKKAAPVNDRPTGDARAHQSGGIFAHVILVVMFISGGVAFAYEVLWARLLAHVLGGSLYAFATMLAAFLAGIAAGGLIGARIARDRRRSSHWLAAVEIGTGILTAIIFSIVTSDQFGGSAPTIGGQASLCALILMPATLCLGATFPLAVRALADDPADAGRSAARVYSWNTIGAIAGAVGAGYFLIPAIGYSPTFKWAISVNLLLGAVVLMTIRPLPTRSAIGAFAIFVASLVFYQPETPLKLMTMSPFSQERPPSDETTGLVHHAVGRSATVAVLQRQGSYIIRTNGLPEAEIFPKGAASLSYTHIRWLPALPAVLRPHTDSLLVVGFGGGALLEAVPRGYEAVDVIELEAEVMEANRVIAAQRAIDPLQDNRINVVINDARGALKLTERKWGAIVSQPSHPWTAGASHLYTEEFVRLARKRLEPGGILVQWLGAQFVDERLMRSFAATMLQAFPHVQLYLIGDNFLFVGSNTSLDDRLFSDDPGDGSVFHLSGYPKLSYVEDMLAVLVCDEAGCRSLAEGHAPITDDRNLMATGHLPGEKLDRPLNEPKTLARVLGPVHYLNRDPAQVRERLGKTCDYRYLTRLLKTAPPVVDRRHFYTHILSPQDRALIEAENLGNRQPERALRVLDEAQAVTPATRWLTARALFSSQHPELTSGAPNEFFQYLDSHRELADAVSLLTEPQRKLMEIDYWAATGQLSRVREADSFLSAFVDHRSVWFETAYQLRLRHLNDPRSKSEEQVQQDDETAIELLDRLLALPIERNLPLVSQRIALAQKYNDVGYLSSTGWIIARKLLQLPASAPEQSRKVFGSLLGSLFTPYASRTAGGSIKIANSRMAAFYRELAAQIGAGSIDIPKASLVRKSKSLP